VGSRWPVTLAVAARCPGDQEVAASPTLDRAP